MSDEAPTQATATAQDKTMGVVAFVLLIFTAWLGPLILYLAVRKEGGPNEANAREALNLGITITLAYALCFVIAALTAFVPAAFWFVLLLELALSLCLILVGVHGAMSANRGHVYRAPVALRIVTQSAHAI